ncbi:MAG: translocation/assembly module TamB domain-containing protein [Sutterellaceae bacterium]|nr:translocation/assembly module TamB domain-containing protein [Sutterellaceae bacterium]
MRVLKALMTTTLALFAGFTTLLVAVVILAVTPWGLSLTVGLLEKALPTLTIEKVQGTLFNAKFEGVAFDDAGIKLSAKSLHYSVANIAPLDRFVSIAHFNSDGLRLEVTSATESTPTEPASEIPGDTGPLVLPVSFEVASIAMSDSFLAFDGTQVQLDAFEASVKGRQSSISLGQTTLKTLALTLPPTPAEEPKPLAQTIASVFEAPLLPTLPDITLPLEVELTQLSLESLSVNNERLVDSLSVRLAAKDSQVTLTKLSVVTPFAKVSGKAQIAMHDAWPLTTDIAFDGIALKDFGTVAGTAAVDGALLSGLNLKAEIVSPDSATLTGTVDIAKAPLPVDLTLSARVKVPQALLGESVKGDADIDVQTLKLTGNFNDWLVSTETTAVLPQYPKIKTHLDVRGQKLAFDYALLLLPETQLKASVTGNGRLTDTGLTLSTLSQATVADINVVLKVLNIDSSHPLAKGNATLDMAANVQTDATFAHFKADFSALKLAGLLAGHPMSVDLEGKVNDALALDVKTFKAQLAKNRLEGHASYSGETLSAKGSLNAPQLSLFDPKLNGTVTGDIAADGALDSINVKAVLKGNGIRYDTYSADRVNLTTDIKALGQTTSKVALSVTGVQAADQTIEKAAVTANGTLAKHTLSADVTGADISARLAWQGKLDEAFNVWASTLTRGDLRVAKTQWSASGKPAFTVNVANQSLTVGKHFWQENKTHARVCVNDTATLAQAGSADIAFADWPLSLAQRYAPAGVRLTGKVKGDIKARWTQPDVEHASVTADIDAAGIGLKARVSDKPVEVTLKTARVAATLAQNKAVADLTVAVTPDNPLKAALTVTDPAGSPQLQARVTSNKLDLDEFSGIISSLSPLTKTLGFVTTDLTLTGTPEAPRVTGNIDIHSLQLYGPTIPLDMQPSDFRLTFAGDNSVFSGKLVSAEGPLNFDGKAEWKDIQAPTAFVHVKGKDFRIVSAPYVKASVTPDVTVAVDDKRIALSGKIEIPRARLSAESIPASAVTVSDDEVIVDADMNPIVKAASKPLAIDSTLAIALGDDVRVEAFGLMAQLTGTVTVTQTNETLGLRGTLTIPDGRFQAYGQDLIIKKGAFIFAGPVSDPVVELVAERNPDAVENDVTVGIRVNGNVSRMQSEIFSDPSMDQASQLSYLLRGRGLETNAEDNSMLSSALLTIGLSQTGQLISGIGDALMIRDLGVSTQGVGDNSQVVVSGYVLPDLQVKYAMSIFDSLSTLTLRYRLMPKLFVEASSGVNQAIEVLYNFEF